MENIYCMNIAEVKKEKNFLERTLKLKIKIEGRSIIIDGPPLNEYDAERVFDAINSGFSARTSALILDEEFAYEKINIRDFTRRKNLETIRARIIGTKGKAKSTIEQITGCKIKVKENSIAIIGYAESVQNVITALSSIIRGTKHANVYKYLERVNTEKRRIES